MSTIKDDVKEILVAEPELPELEYVELPNGMPMFMATDDKIIERAIDAGYQVFYVLGVHKDLIDITPQYPEHAPKQYKKGSPEPRLYKVINNLVSKAIMAVENDNIGDLSEVTTSAWFNLDPIPHELIEKMDTFFRLVDTKYGTEAIVVLIYDTRYLNTDNSEDGWGIIVPKQTNNGAHCSYDPISVLDSIDDEEQEFIRIVGSAHSHPGMAAFASGTDHGDQVGNDGIHITFGWAKNGPTAFHIEMQVADQNWILTEDQAFGKRPGVSIDPEIEAWTDMVEKEVPRPKVQTNMFNRQTSQTYSGTKSLTTSTSKNWSNPGVSGIDDFDLYWNSKVKNLTLTDGIPNPMDGIIFVALTNPSEGKCPVCHGFLMEADRLKRNCAQCYAFLLLEFEKPEDIRDIRNLVQSANNDSLITRWNEGIKQNVPIVFIRRWFDDSTGALKSMVEVIQEGESKKA